ncbi:MAG: hypothetical protein K8S00_09030 [Bacteroidales bacterium]|nr:hypothetical protein [Bacteroidales bacterium]
MNKTRIIFISVMLSLSCVSFAQNRISISNRTPIYMDLTPSYHAGLQKQIIKDDSQWLNYTTLVHPSEPSFSITVEIASGRIPEGLELQIEASTYTGMSKSKPGTPTGKITVTHMPRVLINNISTFYTGSARNEGHKLTFSFIITDYSKLLSGTTTIYVLYTITQ